MTEPFTVTIELDDISGQWWEPELARRIQVLIESENGDLKVKSINAKWKGSKK